MLKNIGKHEIFLQKRCKTLGGMPCKRKNMLRANKKCDIRNAIWSQDINYVKRKGKHEIGLMKRWITMESTRLVYWRGERHCKAWDWSNELVNDIEKYSRKEEDIRDFKMQWFSAM